MKRSIALQTLSREHHTALSLVQRIARAGDEAAVAALMRLVPEKFRAEIEPHFKVEEEGLLVRLAAAGEAALVRRTLDDHTRLRGLAARLADGDGTALKEFGDALRTHVRFEERELFVRAEALLQDEGRD